MTDFNHIHLQDGDEWVCGRSMAFDETELIHCEARDIDEQEACDRCAAQILAYFGEAMKVN